MSASTGTIRRPLGQGSIPATVGITAAALLAVGSIAWGALNLTASKPVAAPVPAPIVLDRGGREAGGAALTQNAGSYIDRGGRTDSAAATGVPAAASSVGASSAAHPTGKGPAGASNPARGLGLRPQ